MKIKLQRKTEDLGESEGDDEGICIGDGVWVRAGARWQPSQKWRLGFGKREMNSKGRSAAVLTKKRGKRGLNLLRLGEQEE